MTNVIIDMKEMTPPNKKVWRLAMRIKHIFLFEKPLSYLIDG